MALLTYLPSAQYVLNTLLVVLGLGMVIFIHELGHFAVAKWCNVKVERFSIGFGPVLFKVTWGETEYALSAIPFGGYVKMLGQDDADPSQLTDVRIARDPRSYTSKTVLQRMAIISAGVFNNMVSAVVFFIIAFLMGVSYEPAIVGGIQSGSPAWQEGMRTGDVITQVENRIDEKQWFYHLKIAVALSDKPVDLAGTRDGKPVAFHVTPRMGEYFPEIGVAPSQSMRLGTPPTPEGAPAAKAGLEPKDLILKVDGKEVENFKELQLAFARTRSKAVKVTVERAGGKGEAPKLVDLTLPAIHFKSVGLRMDIGKIAAIQKNSPAYGKLNVGDKMTHVITPDGEHAIGADLDPLRLPDFFAKYHGKEIKIRFTREPQKGEATTEEVTLTPDDRPGWLERPGGEDSPLSVPAIGVAFKVLHTVLKVDPKSPAAAITPPIKAGAIVETVEFISPDSKAKPDPIAFAEEKRNWAAVFNLMQDSSDFTVKIKFKDRADAVELKPAEVADWYLPIRGIQMEVLQKIHKASSVGEAISLGFWHTRDRIAEMYYMIRALVSGRVSKRALGGPITIFKTAAHFADKGVADLILFLGILSVSLAVMNFMPVPVLDGGHFMFLLWEGIRGRPASNRVMETATWIGLAMILSLMMWVMFLDLGRMFW